MQVHIIICVVAAASAAIIGFVAGLAVGLWEGTCIERDKRVLARAGEDTQMPTGGIDPGHPRGSYTVDARGEILPESEQ